jgi:hypothetical protein
MQEEWRVQLEVAREYHARHRSDMQLSWGQATSFGLEAIRSSVLINVGALIAMLGLVSASKQLITHDVQMLTRTFTCFVSGVFISSLASGVAWIAQELFTKQMGYARETWKVPYIEAKGWRYHRIGVAFRYLAVAMVVFGHLLFVMGALSLLTIIRTAPP